MELSKSFFIKVLGVFGIVSHGALAAGEFRDDVHVLMYETDGSLEGQQNTPLHFFKERSKVAGLRTTVYGNNLEYRGFGDKYNNLRPLLEIVDPDTLIILADARDVALNVPEDEDLATAAVDHFVDNFYRLTMNNPNAVVLSAEAQCCVSAMSHANPGEYFDAITGKRNKRACSSGKQGCEWSENDNIRSWVDFMHQRAYNTTGIPSQEAVDVYLNAGLMAGYPKDLIHLLDIIDIDPSEDDQAVLTGLMYTYPDMLVLDYGQEMFGNNQWTRGVEDGCVFEGYGSESPLTHMDTQTQPLMIHTPGKFYACLDILIEALGGQSQQRYNPTTRRLVTGRLSLAAQLGIGGAAAEILKTQKELAAAAAAATEEAAVEVPAEAATELPAEAKIEEEIIPEEVLEEFFKENAENYGVVETIAENYGVAAASNYGNYGTASNYGNYGVRRRTA